MNKLFLMVIGAIILLVISGLILFWIFYFPQSPISGNGKSPTSALFPESENNRQKPISGSSPGAGNINIINVISGPDGQKRVLTQLTQKAVSGAAFVENQQSTSSQKILIRYIEKATGHIYDIDPQNQETNPNRVSGATIPGIFDSRWSNDAKKVVVRYAESIEGDIEETSRVFSILSVAGTSTPGIFLDPNISAITLSPKKDSLFYITSSGNANIGLISSFDAKKQKQIFTSPFKEFRVDWPNDKIIALMTKPSASDRGYLYKLDPNSGSIEKILGGINGLTALWSPSGQSIVYSESDYKNMKTLFYNLKQKTARQLIGMATLPEKCVWSGLNKDIIFCAIPSALPSADYPDDWYQGLISFSDDIWKIDTAKGTDEIILDKKDNADMELDIINLSLNQDENYLLFQNKKDGALWSFKIN